MRDRLHADFQRPPRLAELAATAGVHPMHMTCQFRRFAGMSIGAYLRRLRLQWCIDQLNDSTMSLSEIAFQAGFADQSHFTRTFRNHTGLTPGRYRAVCRHRAPAG